MLRCAGHRCGLTAYAGAMEAMRSTWTDARLNEFKDQVNANFKELGQHVDHQSQRIDSLQHTILIVGGGIFAAFVAVLAAIIGLIATQL
jgi:hypothetical protein